MPARAATRRTATQATVEVDVMPFLGRADWGGPFNAYYESLANLGAEYVRYVSLHRAGRGLLRCLLRLLLNSARLVSILVC